MSEQQNVPAVNLPCKLMVMNDVALDALLNADLAHVKTESKLRDAEKRIAELEKKATHLWMCDHCKAAFSEPYPHTESSCPVCRAIMRFTGPRY